jgi:hypothetical protein
MIRDHVAGADNHCKEEHFEGTAIVATAANVQSNICCAINSDTIRVPIMCSRKRGRIPPSSLPQRSEGRVSKL